jgi:hypothetical protein
MTSLELKRALSQKKDMVLQKDEMVIKSYEKQKFIYLVTRGEILEEYKSQNKVIIKKTVSFGQLANVGILLMNHKKDLEFSAIAQSMVSLFCFPVNEIKEIISNKSKL